MNALMVAGSIGSAPLPATRSADRSSEPGSSRASWRDSTAQAKLGAVVMVALWRLISSAHITGRLRKSIGVTLTSSIPVSIGSSRQPTMPMSWNIGSQDTITPVSSQPRC